ncbi:hypothetical protein [Paraburkholderia tropica]|nr:hypothetical protein [Paraburkholderia tropica]
MQANDAASTPNAIVPYQTITTALRQSGVKLERFGWMATSGCTAEI